MDYYTDKGYVSLYTFNIKLNYKISTKYYYSIVESNYQTNLEEFIYIMGDNKLVSKKSEPSCPLGDCSISDNTSTDTTITDNLEITPNSDISSIKFLIDKNKTGNTLNYTLNYNNDSIISVDMVPVPLILRTLYELSNKSIPINIPQEIPLYDTTRTQTINQNKIGSDFNNGFYYINNNNNTFNILATTYSVQYSFGGEFFFNIDTSSLEENKNYTITINALIDSKDSNKIGTTSFIKDMKPPTQGVQGVKVNLFADVILILNMKTHTINLSWTITSDKAINNINILNTKGSYFEFLVDNTALCNV
jgi:hypothetical protein